MFSKHLQTELFKITTKIEVNNLFSSSVWDLFEMSKIVLSPKLWRVLITVCHYYNDEIKQSFSEHGMVGSLWSPCSEVVSSWESMMS